MFDLGDVLFDATVWRRWLLRLLRHFGVQAPYHSLFRRWETEYLADVYCGTRDYDHAFFGFLSSLGLRQGQIAEIAVASQARHREFNLQSRPYPGVVTTLRELKRLGYRLAVLTNSTRCGSDLHMALEQLGLGNLFDAVVTSIDLGMLASCHDAYQAIHDRLQLRVGKALFVGHDRTELASAAQFGMPTMAFNYEDATPADVHIEQFDEMVALMTSMGHARAA